MNLDIDAIITEIVTEVGGDNDDSTFVANMLSFFKAGIRHIPGLIRSRLFIGHTTKTLASGDSSIDLSTLDPGFIRERAVWMVQSENKRQAIIKADSIAHFHELYSPNGSGDPQYYQIYDKTMEFDKSADIDKTIGLEYFKEISDILGTDTFFGDEPLLEACKHYCKMIYYGDYEENDSKSDKHERRGDKLIFNIQGDYEAAELGGCVEQTDD